MAQEKPHVVCVPFPAQGHINPMMSIAKLLHSHGFHVTFALTDYERARLLRSRGPRALDGLPSFCFASFPDGLPPSVNAGSIKELDTLFDSLHHNCAGPFTNLLTELGQRGGPHVSCVVADVSMAFTLEAAEALGVKVVMFWPAGACSLLGVDQCPRLLQEGYIPLKDSSDLTNGYLDTPLEWISPMKGIRLKDIPTFIRTTDPNDILLHILISIIEKSQKASAIILNTFDGLEHDILAYLAPDFPPLYPIGPLHILLNNHDDRDNEVDSIGSNLWEEDQRCLEWLDSKEPGSVLYVNFGSMVLLNYNQLLEFAYGLANSGKQFMWVIRPDLVDGESTGLPSEFVEETKERSFIVEWCDQVRVLSHTAIGGFLTHSGWNSTIESVGSGVPMISWPFVADQVTNCWMCCNKWEIGMELDHDVSRENVEMKVRELMDEEMGRKMKKKAMELQMLAHKTVAMRSGENWKNVEKLIDEVLLSSK